MKHFRLTYADGRTKIIAAPSAIDLIRSRELATLEHIQTRIVELSGEEAAMAHATAAPARRGMEQCQCGTCPTCLEREADRKFLEQLWQEQWKIQRKIMEIRRNVIQAPSSETSRRKRNFKTKGT